jgi:hypothetical protein
VLGLLSIKALESKNKQSGGAAMSAAYIEITTKEKEHE